MLSSWRGPLQLAGVAIIITIVALWATRPPPTCDMTVESHSHLDLDRTVDREHLAADLGASERIARRYSAHLPAHPDAQGLPPRAPDADTQQCQARLAQQIMTTHDLTIAQIVASARRTAG